MSPKKTAFIFLISLAFTEVATWTIDLPEARKHFFEKAEEHNIKKSEEIKKDFNNERLFFDNIVPDSPHNKDELDHTHEISHEIGNEEENDVNGANDPNYEYMSYMEKKVHNIVHNGSVYLEGLRVALEDYAELLKNCSRQNLTQTGSRGPNGPWLPENERPMPSDSAPQPPNFDTNNFGPGNFTQIPNGTLFRQLNQTLDAETCERATRYSEHVRRLSELALWATRELQDRAYASKYEKQSHDEEEEEAELLLRLAFFLDRLAYLTGYEPQPRDFITTTTSRPVSPTVPMSVMGDVSDEAKTSMMNCIQSDSTDPNKCRFQQTSPEFLRRLFNITDSSQNVQPASYTPTDPTLREIFRNPTVPPAPLSRQKRHLHDENLTAEQRKDLTDNRVKRGIVKHVIAKRPLHLEEENLTAEKRKDLTDSRDKRGIVKDVIAKRPLHLEDDNLTAEERKDLTDNRDKRGIVKDVILKRPLHLEYNENLTGAKRKDLTDDRDKRGIVKDVIANKIAHKIAEWHEERQYYHEDHEFHRDHEFHEPPFFPRRKILMEGLAVLKEGGKKLIGKLAEFSHEHQEFDRRDNPIERKKRSTYKTPEKNPAVQLMQYYVKHQVWANSNPAHKEKLGDYDVQNHLDENNVTTDNIAAENHLPIAKIHKRSIDKKYEYLKSPEDPFKDISSVVKHRPGVNYVNNKKEAEKLHEYLEKITHSKPSIAKDYVRKLLKKHNIQKRSVKYENKFLPSKSQNPRQDISYYIKNKEGTNYNPDLVQGRQVRANLEAIFQRPNIEVVRQYGSSTGPVSYPLGYGQFMSFFADI